MTIVSKVVINDEDSNLVGWVCFEDMACGYQLQGNCNSVWASSTLSLSFL